eukprot:CAMPEP_0202003774 /NCGR_PEP_ID=MMETSP0905-20130828/9266_1 /ASSEMBLY_ACC=CAM_ASM_000554 /TAXON_ID=420261 /ORGANISM="Thalassiosira antarctica, Strain CCMP982" /LENGTH=796 /DNA_ID=CAMNT_0048560987 /DNA_START=226 /DNA_END=2613 /DNA_ORIENTATION=+
MTSSHLAVIAATLLSSTSGGRASAKLQGGPTDVHSTGSARGDHEVDRNLHATTVGAPEEPAEALRMDIKPSFGHGRGRALEESPIFPTAQLLRAGYGRSIAIGDINGDGFNDVVFGNSGENELFLNDGAGNFPGTPVILPGGSLDTYGVAIGDFNNDQLNDIFFANLGSAQQLLINDGNGNFTSAQAIPILDRTTTLTLDAHAIDINGDGNLDVVITAYSNSYGSNVLLGDGTGNFTAIELDDGFYKARSVSSADFNGDGHIDLVIANNYFDDKAGTSNTNPGTNLFLNDGNTTHPTFTRQNIPHSFGSGRGYGIAATDVNNDGRADFIVTRYYFGSSLLFLNDNHYGVANFTQSELPGYSNQHGWSVDVADVNGDEYADIAIGNIGQPNQLLLNNGMGGFDADGVFELPEGAGEQQTYGTKFGDINGDSMPDIVFNNNPQQKVVLLNILPPPPTTTTEDVWQIVFTGLDANFTATSTTELSMKFDIGKNPPSDGSTTGRYNTKLYEKDCATEIATSGTGPLLFTLVDNGRISKSPANSTFDAIDLLYDVNKAMIAASSVWNSTTNEIEICQEVQLIEKSSTLEMVIVEDKRVITINFDLSASFDLGVDLEEAALTSANTTTNVKDYVNAYKCDESFAEDNSPLVANDELFVCIESSSIDVEIEDIESMTIKQDDIDLPVIASIAVAYPAITEKIVLSAIKQVVMTRVPSNVISFAPGNVIIVDGSVTMQLVGSSGRMLQTALNTGGTEAVTTSFDIKVALQPEATPKDDLALNSATSLASKTSIAFGMILALAVW